MPADLYFALTLIAKMAATAAVVLAATVTAERAGPLVGGLVASLPIGAGPVYVFLALDQDSQFIAASAVGSLAVTAVNVALALTYAMLAQRYRLAISLPVAFAVWVVLALAINLVEWTLLSAGLMNVAVTGVALWLVRPLRNVPMPRVHASWHDLAMRAILAAALVAVVVTFSFRIGPAASGILAVFPVVLMSIMYILHRRVGGKPSAAVLANAILGLVGFGFATVALHLSAVPLGSALGLSLALAVSVGWGFLIYGARRRGIPV